MRRIAVFLATVAYVGYLPKAPGTFGSLVGVAIVLALSYSGAGIYLGVLAAAIIIGIWSAQLTEKEYGVKDDGRIVIDEVAGFLLTMLMLEVTLKTLFLGFIFFRIYDIWKPVPRLEKLPGGVGVMADDLMAGFLANLSVRAVMLVW